MHDATFHVVGKPCKNRYERYSTANPWLMGLDTTTSGESCTTPKAITVAKGDRGTALIGLYKSLFTPQTVCFLDSVEANQASSPSAQHSRQIRDEVRGHSQRLLESLRGLQLEKPQSRSKSCCFLTR